MNLQFPTLAIWVLILMPVFSLAHSNQDSLYQESVNYLESAIVEKRDFVKKAKLAQQALDGFEQLKEDSLIIETKFLLAKTAYYRKDSLTFITTIDPIVQQATSQKDTNTIVRAYNLMGVFYFSIGHTEKGLKVLEIPDKQQYYTARSLDENIFNLGALVDVSLTYTNNLDSVYYYVNKLQELATLYPDPSIQVVSRFKTAQLFSKATNYGEALKTLKAAYPYLDKLKNKGFLHYYYKGLISNFLYLEKPDSVNHYIKILEEVASYPPNDPRNCYVIVSKLRAKLSIENIRVLPVEFKLCYDQAFQTLEKTKKAGVQTLSLLYVQSLFLLNKKDWQSLDKVLPVLKEYAQNEKSKEYVGRALEIQYKSLKERGLIEEALAAHILYKEQNDEMNKYIFSHSESMLKNQMNLELAEEENRVLQIENQNQKLRLARDRSVFFLFLLGILLLIFLVSYFIQLSFAKSRQSKELERLVKERTTQLEQTNEVLSKTNQDLLVSNAELERFAFIASHDLKTPLQNMIQFAGLLARKLKSNKDEDIATYLSFIIKGGKRMHHLIEDVLEFSKLNKSENLKENEITNLNDVVHEIRKSISEYLRKKNGAIEIKAPLPSIRGNHAKLFILFKNLIENGMKYNESSKPIVKVYHSKNPKFFSIFFEDNGIGIGEAFHGQIFEMFTRLHTYLEYEGTGLGLSTCKKITEEFGGEISLESQINEYTVFRIDLPIHLLEHESIAQEMV